MKKFALGLCLLALASICNATILVSTQGVLADPNAVFEQSFTYNPATMGGLLIIQSYGYGGSANGNVLSATGRNLAGNIIAPGGFDTTIALYAGAVGAGGARLFNNDDGTCGPLAGTTDAGICFDSRLVINGLAAGTYTVALSVFPNFPPSTENGAYPNTGNFTDVTGSVRTNAFALDVAAVPEPMTFGLMGAGLLGLGLLRRRMKK